MNQTVVEARAARDRAEARSRAANAALYETIRLELFHGLSVTECAESAGLSRQAVYNITAERSPAEAWLDDFDKRYAKLVDTLARSLDDPKTACKAGETAKSNGRRAVLTRKLRGDAVAARAAMPSVLDVARREAENKLRRLLDSRPDDPSLAAVARDLARAETVRAEVTRAQLERLSDV